MTYPLPTRWTLFYVLFIAVATDAWTTSRLFSSPKRLHHTTRRFFSYSEDSSIETVHGPWNATIFGSTQCWGHRPLLLRNAFDTESLPSWKDIAELACNDDEEEPITSRIIQHKPGTSDTFQVNFGPFRPDELIETMKNDEAAASTLVVNDVDRWIPNVSDWMDSQFEFLPRWRRDDAQVSLAATGGGIGPHVDNYDVFLIQASGSREWEVGLHEISVNDEFANLVKDSEVRILNMTLPTVKVHLQEGDCLYIPPRIMHCGTSTSDDCVTLSVGCRAPSAADILSRMAESIATSTGASAVERYTDIDLLQVRTDDKRLSGRTKDSMKQLVLHLVEDFVEDDSSWDEFVGRLITEPNRPTLDYPMPLHVMDDDWKNELGIWADADKTLDAVVAGKGVLRRAEGISFAWSTLPEATKYRLYAQGRVFEIEDAAPCIESLLDRVANGPPLDRNGFRDLKIELSPSMRRFLLGLLEEGFLYGDEETT
jgi:50S ribosomal protein L16 3-hydroxylase